MNRTRNLLALPALALTTAIAPQQTEQRQLAPVLVSTTWLAEHLRDEKLVILHVGNEGSYTPGHIPGARLITIPSFTPEKNGLSTEMPEPDELRDVLQTAGVSNDSRIIIYSSAHPPTLAARLYVTLDHFGLGAQTSLLDGGMRAWRAENRQLSAETTPAKPGSLTLRPRTDVLVDHATVNARLTDPSVAVLDARDTRFYTGEQQNTSRATRAGRVPGAHNVVYSSLVSESGLLIGKDSILKLFTSAGAGSGKQVLAYCHVGQQASLAFIAARVAGYDVRLYDGSYEDWSKRPELRVDTGPPRQ